MSGYAIAHVDELERLHAVSGDTVWRPVRRRFGIDAFGANVWAGDAGQVLIAEHAEQDGQQELYVVLRGRAAFTIDGEPHEVEAPTLVYVQPGTARKAVAAEDGTAILAVGSKSGEPYRPFVTEGIFAALSYARQGDVERGKRLVDDAMAQNPSSWQAPYNAACFESLFGDRELAIEYLLRAHGVDADPIERYAPGDPDLDPIRDDPRVSAIAGKAPAGSAGT